MAQTSITELLQRSGSGDNAALRELYAQLYPEIKRVARARLAQSGGVPGLDTTALVHEGFLRLADQAGLQGGSRGQFFAYVGQVLRSVVIDLVRHEGRDKRGGAGVHVTLSAAEQLPAGTADMVELLALDAALGRMRTLDPPLAELIEITAFAGVELGEVAMLRGVSLRTVQRDLFKARALLQQLLDGAAA
jgi:RNA polymerase sigma factor (TIGR02999 family)